jgi:diketogulonate reductase-like aldo/keto reductase
MAKLNRRRFLTWLLGLGASSLCHSLLSLPTEKTVIRRTIPSSGEQLPVIGMGSSRTFDVGDDELTRAVRVEVLQAFFDRGGAILDSSPMYGTSEEVIGYCLERIKNKDALFSATKVWTPGRWVGINQMKHSAKLWGVSRFDLMQIHNMLDWETHIETLKEWKAEGKIRYMGITTSHGRRHKALLKAMEKEPFDFVQFSYNIMDREVEQYLLPLAAERGIAVIINRPFQRGALFDYVNAKSLPVWAQEFDCENWAQFFLKFIVSHPAVTCAIPATTRVDHMLENMGAGYGRLPEPKTRQRMIRYFKAL